MVDKKVRGAFVSGAFNFAKARYSADQCQCIQDQMSADLRTGLPQIKPNEWYPLHFATDMLRGIQKMHKDAAEWEVAIRECGVYIGEEASTTFVKLLFSILTPQLFAQKFPQFWAKYNSFGDIRSDITGIKDKTFVLELMSDGYDYVHLIGAGWIEFVFKKLGKQGVVVSSNIPSGQVSADYIRWETHWQ